MPETWNLKPGTFLFVDTDNVPIDRPPEPVHFADCIKDLIPGNINHLDRDGPFHVRIYNQVHFSGFSEEAK